MSSYKKLEVKTNQASFVTYTNTHNVNKIRVILQGIRGKDQPSIVCMRKS